MKKITSLILILIFLSNCSFFTGPKAVPLDDGSLLMSRDVTEVVAKNPEKCKDAVEECILQNEVLLDENKVLNDQIDKAGVNAGLIFGAGGIVGVIVGAALLWLILPYANGEKK